MLPPQTSLRDLREISRLSTPELSAPAREALQSRMAIISDGMRHSGLTDYLGREHFDAFASTKEGERHPRNVASMLFNQLVDSEHYGFDAYRRTRRGDRYPRRLIFDLRPFHIQDMIITAKRAEVGLGPYTDELPCLSSFTGQRAVRNALEQTVEAGSLITLVEQGLRHKERINPSKQLTRAERLVTDLVLHLQ